VEKRESMAELVMMLTGVTFLEVFYLVLKLGA
jgi:hypothetical protein